MPGVSELSEFFRTEFPQQQVVIESVGNRAARIRRPVDAADLRPGNTVSGPFMMGVADTALYAAILAEIGLVALAVTTSLNINFFRRPSATADVIGDCKLLKVGKKLIVGEVTLYSAGDNKPIAHAVGTYALPD
ncbi:MAG: PaaI family thioesterase [Gammaproteobacteria bacterium]|nr:PaaI family thioesterase [Gammaproteobacteria bacterium]